MQPESNTAFAIQVVATTAVRVLWRDNFVQATLISLKVDPSRGVQGDTGGPRRDPGHPRGGPQASPGSHPLLGSPGSLLGPPVPPWTPPAGIYS